MCSLQRPTGKLGGPAMRLAYFFFFLMIRHPPKSTLFPSTALFRSHVVQNPRVLKLNVLYCTKLPPAAAAEMGRADVCTPVTIVFRILSSSSFYNVIRRDRISASLGRVSGERIAALKRRLRDVLGL